MEGGREDGRGQRGDRRRRGGGSRGEEVEEEEIGYEARSIYIAYAGFHTGGGGRPGMSPPPARISPPQNLKIVMS